MALRSERERSKMQEKYQMILSQMLKEDDNRFCVDCDTKSPRWASWNLGIFICIRCAGFHRNLGVHISRVKSVNLDSWTAEQIASMQAMGNNRARAVYEANLPAGFRRPQADSALEAFIRAKYEQRKWIEKEWIPPEIMVSSDLIESESNTRRNEPVSDVGQKEKSTSNSIPKLKGFPAPTSTNVSVRQSGNDRPGPNVSVPSIPTPVAISKVETPPDLLGLDEPTLPKSSVSINGSATTVNSTANFIDPLQELFSTPTVNTVLTTNNENPNSFTDLNKDLESAFTTPSNPTANTGGVMTTEKIMALYNTPSSSMKPSSSGINLNFSAIQPVHQQQQHSSLLAHQKSASFGGNLYPQQASVPQHGNNFPVRPQYPTNTLAYPSQSGMPQMTHPNAYAMSTPTLQSPASNFNQDQLTNQFSQFVPFANSKTNTAASTLISGMPTRPVTDMMPATSDLLWQ